MTHKSISPFALLSLVLTACPGAAPNSDGLDDAATAGVTTSSGATATASGAGPAGGSTTSQGGDDLTTSGGGDPTTTGGGDPATSGGGDPTTDGSTSGGGDGGRGGAGGEGGATSVSSSSSSSGSGGEGGYMPECDNGIVDPGELCFDAAPTHYDGPRIPIPADVDGDGFVDLASMSLYFPDDNALRICAGDGSGTFATGAACAVYPGKSGVSFARLDPDNVGLDAIGVAFIHPGSYGRRVTGFTFSWTELDDPGFYDNMAAGDLNDDGAVDLVMVQKGPRLRSFLNDGDGAFAMAPHFDASVSCETDRVPQLADFDADGDLDLFVSCFFAGLTTTNPSVRVLRGTGTGSFGQPLDMRFPYPDGFILDSVQGDVDDDGIVDVVVGYRSDVPQHASLEVLRGRGDGTFDAPRRVAPPIPARYVEATRLADLDQDGNVDLVATFTMSGATGFAYVFRGDGAGDFATGELLFPEHVTADGNSSLGIAAVDLNGDGALDLVRGTPTSDVWVGAGLDVFLATP